MHGAAFDDLPRPDEGAGRGVEDGKKAFHRGLRDHLSPLQLECHRRGSNVKIQVTVRIQARQPLAGARRRIKSEHSVIGVADAHECDAVSIDGGRRPHAVAWSAVDADAHRPPHAAGRGVETEQPPRHQWDVAVR